MGFMVFAAFLVVVAFVLFFGGRIAKAEAKKNNANESIGGLVMVVGPLATVLVLLIFAVLASTDTVENGHIGIVKQFSSYTNATTGSGLVTHAPWQSIDEVSIQNEKRVYQMGTQGVSSGNIEVDVRGGSAVSRDSQAISLIVQVNYTLARDKAVELYRSTGGQFKSRILDNAVFQEAKSKTAAFAATEFAANREQVRANIEQALSDELRPQGILVNNVSLLDVGYSEGLSKAIELTVERKQAAKAAQAQVAVTQAEAQQKVAKAEGDAKAVKIAADAKAYQNRVTQRSLTPLLVQQQAIDKLNPNVEVIVCPLHTNCVPQAVLSTVGK